MQVVAGFNFALLLSADTGCLAGNKTVVAQDSVRLAATVFKDLGDATEVGSFSLSIKIYLMIQRL